jgi:isopentenyl diphosphate isomerase/L-lactate dehydrogenase-like FMN-dependent dehydrogenase
VLCDIARVDAGTSVFGRLISLPLALVPVGSVDTVDSGGLATVAAATDRGVPASATSPPSAGPDADRHEARHDKPMIGSAPTA